MMIETGFAYLNRSRRLPVPVSVLPSVTRLALILPDLEDITVRAASGQALRQHNERVIREALQYTPPFAKEIAEDLRPTRILLLESGFIPDRTEKEKAEAALNKQVADTLKEYTFSPKIVDPKATAQEAARKISKTLHPDVADPVTTEIFSATESNTVYKEALRVAREEDVEKAQTVLIETMPRYYLYRIQRMMADGMSLAEIVSQNPELLPELEQLRWVALHRLPKEDVDKRFGKPEEVERKAARIRRKNEHHARTAGLAIIYGVCEDVFEFAKARGITPSESANQFDKILSLLQDAGGYVGGTGEFSYQRGGWVVTPNAATLAKIMEGLIKVLPHGFYHLMKVIVSPETTPEAVDKALTELRHTIADVRISAEMYGEELVAAAIREEEERRRYKNSIFDISSIIDSVYTNKNRKY